MSKTEKILVQFKTLLYSGLNYQLATRGAFKFSNSTSKTEVINSDISLFGYQFISSGRLEFDGGIELHFSLVNKLGIKSLELLGHNLITASIYNLESTDGEHDLEQFFIRDLDDCKFININLDFSKANESGLDELDTLLKSHIASTEIGSLRTFIAMKFGKC